MGATDGVDGPELGPEPVPEVELAGMTVDYFSQRAIAGVEVETMGLAPERSAASGDGGAFSLSVPEASWFFVRTVSSATHTPTITEHSVDDSRVAAAVYVVSNADVERQHATAGVAIEPGSTMIIVDVADPSGAPVEGLRRSDLSVLDQSGRLVATEPYVFGAVGDIDPSLGESEIHAGASRFAFLNVEPGPHQLVFSCLDCVPAIETQQTVIAGAGVTFTRLVAAATPGPAETSFEAVFPLFARGIDGGVGCANCHTGGGVAPVLDGDIDTAYQALRSNPAWVNPAAPDASQLLSKPLYEVPANHPNATFLSTEDPNYVAIRTWIAAGAQP